MPVPYEPRETWVIEKARSFIRQAGISWLPVDPIKIAGDCGWPVLTSGHVSKLAKVPRHMVFNGNDGGVFRCGDSYRIVYNEQAHKPRISFTIAHEIAHIVLGHLKDFEQTQFSCDGFVAYEYQVLEREADIFAAELLMPLPVLRATKPDSPAVIAEVCGVSKSTALIRHAELQRSYAGDNLSDDDWMCSQFSWFLTPVATCAKSGSSHKKTTLQQNIITKPEQVLSVMEGASAREYITCGRCGDPSVPSVASFCKSCGLFFWGDENEAPRNPGITQYCIQCGGEVYLSFLGFLATQEAVEQAVAKISEVTGQDREKASLTAKNNCATSLRAAGSSVVQYCYLNRR